MSNWSLREDIWRILRAIWHRIKSHAKLVGVLFVVLGYGCRAAVFWVPKTFGSVLNWLQQVESLGGTTSVGWGQAAEIVSYFNTFFPVDTLVEFVAMWFGLWGSFLIAWTTVLMFKLIMWLVNLLVDLGKWVAALLA